MKYDHRLRPTAESHETNLLCHYAHEPWHPPLIVKSAGSSVWYDQRTMVRCRCDLSGIEYVVAGSIIFMQDGREYRVRPGEVFVLRRGARHLYRVGPEGYMLKRYVTMEGESLDTMLRISGLSMVDIVRPVSPSTVSRLLKEVSRLLRHKPRGYLLHNSHLAYRLLLELGRGRVDRYPAAVRAAIEFMERNLHRPLRSREIAREAGLSSTHLNRLFARYLKSSPIDFFITRKLEYARHLLAQTPMQVQEIAREVGYEDPLYFSAQFRKAVGESPSRYRKGIQGRD